MPKNFYPMDEFIKKNPNASKVQKEAHEKLLESVKKNKEKLGKK